MSAEPISDQDSTPDTIAHIRRVDNLLGECVNNLLQRGRVHDASKLEEPEKSAFDRLKALSLSGMAYGSEEYRASLRAEKPAIEHHYKANSHHPEHEECAVEEWRSIAGYEESYQVSNLGRVRSVERTVKREGGRGDLKVKEMIRKGHITPKGYVRIQLAASGVAKNHMIHVLVAEAFIGPAPSERHEVNHKHGNKSDNRATELEWMTPSQNLQHAYDNDLKQPNTKYVFVCETLGITTLGAVKMAEACHLAGHPNVSASGVHNSAMRGGYHHDLQFSASLIEHDVPYSGVDGMSLFDVMEMLMDWKAATERMKNGGAIHASLVHNIERFKLSPQLANILANTIREMGWPKPPTP